MQSILAGCFAWLMSMRVRDERGASGIEYALLAAMVPVILAGFVPGIQASITTIFANLNAGLAKG